MVTINITATGNTGDEELVQTHVPTDLPESTDGEPRLNVVFTGHRAINGNYPNDYTNLPNDRAWGQVAHSLVKFGEWITKKGYEPHQVTFINGGAVGFDLAAIYGLILPWKQMGAHFKLCLAWPGYWNDRWDKIPHIAGQIRAAYDSADSYDYAQQIDDGQWAKALNQRNEVMVNYLGEGDVLMGMWSGAMRGGTWNCLKYAKERRVGLFGASYTIMTVNPNTGKWEMMR